MEYVRFLSKAIIICFGKKEKFDYKNNYKCGKLANFRLDNISKFNCRMLIVLLYILSRLRLKKIQFVWRFLK